MLRLPDGMRDRIKAAADANNRSMNAEIVATLEQKYPPPRVDLTFSQILALVQFVEGADTRKEMYDRLDLVNEQIAPSGASLVLAAGRNGLETLFIQPGNDTQSVLRHLPSGYSAEEEAELWAEIDALDPAEGEIISENVEGPGVRLRKAT